MIKKHKLFAFCAIGTLTFAWNTPIANAEEIPIAGIDLVLNNILLNDQNNNIDLKDFLTNGLTNQNHNISFANVSNYVNIRRSADDNSQILGKLYNNSAAYILEKSGAWYKVKSGTVTGYIKAEFLITGTEAEQKAKEIGKRIAIVTTTTLKVREKPSTDATVMTLVAKGDEYIVNKESAGWVQITFDGDKTGYIADDYTQVKIEYEEAVSIEEEQDRIDAEQTAIQSENLRLAEQKAIQAEKTRQKQKKARNQDSRESVTPSRNQSNGAKVNTSNENSDNSSIRSKIVNYALRFKGNPYVWGGTSLTQGADCSGFTQSVFRDNGISIPRTSRTQAIGGKRVSIESMKPSDLIFYDKNGTINHVGIYIGNGKIIAASSPKTGIRITSYNYRTPYKVVSYIGD